MARPVPRSSLIPADGSDVCNRALKTRSRFVELGRSMRHWLLSMGVRDCGTNYKVVGDQAERIENCVLRFRYQGREGENRWQDSIVRGSFRPFAEDGVAAVELSEGSTTR
jgi:hypothetical protein